MIFGYCIDHDQVCLLSYSQELHMDCDGIAVDLDMEEICAATNIPY